MAKRGKTTGRNLADQLPNRFYQVVTWGADSTAAVLETADTMMGAREGAAWLISRIDIQPRGILDGLPAGTAGFYFQVATGEQTALLNADDDEAIMTLGYGNVTAGSAYTDHQVWPISWFGPVLVASRKLSFGMDASDNLAPFQSVDMLFTVWFNWVKMTAQRWIEVQEAKGIL